MQRYCFKRCAKISLFENVFVRWFQVTDFV